MRSTAGMELHPHAGKLRLALALCAAFGIATVHAASEAIEGYTDSIGAYGSGTVGWTFQCTNVLAVTQLGCFAKVFDGNPFLTSVQVGLWDHTGLLLASNSVSPTSPPVGQGRYELVNPVSLAPGEIYHLGAYPGGGSMGVDVAGPVAGGVVNAAAEIQIRAAASAGAGFAIPQELAGTSGSIYAGPNFIFETRPTLEIRDRPGNRVRLSWPTVFAGYTLQSEIGLSSTWTNSGLTVTNAGGQYVAFDNIGALPKYYRLVK